MILFAVNPCVTIVSVELSTSRMVKPLYYHLISSWGQHQYVTHKTPLVVQPPSVGYHFLKDIFRVKLTHWWNVVPNYISMINILVASILM